MLASRVCFVENITHVSHVHNEIKINKAGFPIFISCWCRKPCSRYPWGWKQCQGRWLLRRRGWWHCRQTPSGRWGWQRLQKKKMTLRTTSVIHKDFKINITAHTLQFDIEFGRRSKCEQANTYPPRGWSRKSFSRWQSCSWSRKYRTCFCAEPQRSPFVQREDCSLLIKLWSWTVNCETGCRTLAFAMLAEAIVRTIKL